MNAKTKTTEKRFVPITTFCKTSGLSYATVDHMCKSGQLNYITTERGQRRIDTLGEGSDSGIVLAKLEMMEKKLSALCKQMNTVV